MEKEKIILTNNEQGLVKAIWDYMRESGELGDSVDDFGYEMLSDLQHHILSEHGYEQDEQSDGEYTDWDQDSWESIIVYYDKEMEETEKQILKEIKKIRVTDGKGSEVYT